MNDLKKSDPAVVAMRSANKGRQRPAEPVEPRAGAEGNPGSQSTRRAQKRAGVPQAADRIRQAAKRNPDERLVALLHHVTVPVLEEAFHSLKRDAGAGVDGVTWDMYAEGLGDRLVDLHARIHRGAYRAPPVRRVEIPKSDGGKRPVGIASLEDKLVQKAVTDTILVPIYETEFLGFSYGFRPGRGWLSTSLRGAVVSGGAGRDMSMPWTSMPMAGESGVKVGESSVMGRHARGGS